jgi:hypothetical protein
MSITHIGLLCDIVGVAFIGFESFVKLRGMKSNMLRVGHGVNDALLQFVSFFGYTLLIIGFILQFIGPT